MLKTTMKPNTHNFQKLRTFKTLDATSLLFLCIFLAVIAFTVVEILYYNYESNGMTKVILQKRKAVSLIQLPDITTVSEAVWLRHRSVSTVFTIFSEDGCLLDYYPASFVYQPGLPIQHKNPENHTE